MKKCGSRMAAMAVVACMMSVMLTACGKESQETAVMPLKSLEKAEDALQDGEYAVEFTAEDLQQTEDGYELNVTVYDYDRYDVDTVNGLKVGGQIQFCKDMVTVDSLAKNEETGYYTINGGVENGGLELKLEDNWYRTCTMDDYPCYYEVGTVNIPIAEEIVLEDHSDMDNEPDGVITANYDDFLETVQKNTIFFGCGNTTITVKQGEIVKIIRRWVP